MGLTIHYNIEFNGTAKQLQAKLEKIRQKCSDLPFEQVGKVKTTKITKKIIDTWSMLQKKYTYPNNTDENIAKRDLIIKNLGVTTWQMVELGEFKQEGCYREFRER